MYIYITLIKVTRFARDKKIYIHIYKYIPFIYNQVLYIYIWLTSNIYELNMAYSCHKLDTTRLRRVPYTGDIRIEPLPQVPSR